MRPAEFRFFFLFILVAAAGGVWFSIIYDSKETDCYCLQVTFLDVGQGDSILIETPDQKEILIDGGVDGRVLSALSKELSFFDRSLDLVVATHPDTDHIGGLINVLQRYRVGQVLSTSNVNDNPASNALDKIIEEKMVSVLLAEAGQVIDVGQVRLQVFSPAGDETNWPSNNASIVLRVTFGDIDFLLTGDAPAETEDYLVDVYGNRLQSDVLKLGHHGSDTSSSQIFLQTVSPTYAVVSAGANNNYGHPHQDVLARVNLAGATILGTLGQGNITFLSDGNKVWIK